MVTAVFPLNDVSLPSPHLHEVVTQLFRGRNHIVRCIVRDQNNIIRPDIGRSCPGNTVATDLTGDLFRRVGDRSSEVSAAGTCVNKIALLSG